MIKLRRNKQIQKLYREGNSFSVIARLYKISRQRVYQIARGLKGRGRDWQTIRRKVLQRDDDKCQWQEKCNRKTKQSLKNRPQLAIHHIDGNLQNNDLNNLITLCSRCHKYFHAIEGTPNHLILYHMSNNQCKLK